MAKFLKNKKIYKIKNQPLIPGRIALTVTPVLPV